MAKRKVGSQTSNPGGLPSPHFGSVSLIFTHSQSKVVTNMLKHVKNLEAMLFQQNKMNMGLMEVLMETKNYTSTKIIKT
jgi:hypothetical protein